MEKIANIGNLLKKIYRLYSSELIQLLESRGFSDLRPSFLEILSYISESEGCSIKAIGKACGLKKQTMTSHLNELEKRAYIKRTRSDLDKREQNIFLTEYGQQFRISLLEAMRNLEERISSNMGSVELERVEHNLKNFHHKFSIQSEDRLL